MSTDVPIPCSRCHLSHRECTWEDLKNEKLNRNRLRACDHCRRIRRSCDGARPDWATALGDEEKQKYFDVEPDALPYDTKPPSSLPSLPISSPKPLTSALAAPSSLPTSAIPFPYYKLASTPSSEAAFDLAEASKTPSTSNSCQIQSGLTSALPAPSSLPTSAIPSSYSKLASTPSSKPALDLAEASKTPSTSNSCQIQSGGLQITINSVSDSCQIQTGGMQFKIEAIKQSP